MRNLFPAIWFGLKAIVSAVATIGGLVVVFVTAQQTGFGESQPWLLLAIAMLLAVAPWVFCSPPQPRAIALFCVLIGIGTLLFAVAVPYVPKDCSLLIGRRHSSCVLFNWFYSVGGPYAVPALFFAMGLFFLIGGFVLFKRHVHHA